MNVISSESSIGDEENIFRRFEQLLVSYEKLTLMAAEQEEYNSQMEANVLKLLKERWERDQRYTSIFYKLLGCIEKVLCNKMSRNELKQEYDNIIETALSSDQQAYENASVENVRLKKKLEKASLEGEPPSSEA
ncbi:sporulation specific protein Spo2 [Schizosaccharomyces octosporus yFS286]|uniref:Sporulation specific protein Spo2 n=1 Tax=Schizosaccharomyces octosporus (strain yFS286) TaxID=483514 RepID=S9RFQ7_SCHOY|nr:sporulation specific protein Spo2 [Schizosaccharomyces octosporus yFS286]EPX72914.1 sporulation specific protein Spo2 [Schizosaccharomyces octosporus yFS286]